MLVHISSGNGVDEVCRAVWHFKNWLEKNYEFEVIEEQKGYSNEINTQIEVIERVRFAKYNS